jgi:hypothetical protein
VPQVPVFDTWALGFRIFLIASQFDRASIRTIPQFHYHFLSNQLLVDTIYFCYTFSVTRKRSNSPDAPHSTRRIFVASALKNRTHDDHSLFPANR